MEDIADILSLKPVTAVYSSDLQRAFKGAQITAKRLGLKIIKVPEFRELSLGRWEGLTRDEAIKKFPEEAEFRFRNLANSKVIGGESLQDLQNRVLPKLNEILIQHQGKAICLFAHGGVNRVILCDAMCLSVDNFFRIEQDYGCLNVIDYFEDGIRVVKLLNGGPNQLLKETKVY